MNLKFVEMNENEFSVYINHVKQLYEKDLEKYQDELKGDPKKIAKREIKELIPQGLQTPNHHICKIVDSEKNLEVGHIWYALEPDRDLAFLADIFIKKEYRNQGYGTTSLKKLEKVTRKDNHSHILLHVFNHNPRAKNLYERLGYKVKEEVNTGYRMTKKL